MSTQESPALGVEAGGRLIEMLRNGAGLGNIQLHGDGDKPLVVYDPSQPEGSRERVGQFFASLPSKLADVLRGSTVTPKMFFAALGIDSSQVGIDPNDLRGNSQGTTEQPLLFHQEQGEGWSFTLRVFHGATNKDALSASEKAAIGFDDPNVRAEYQGRVVNLARPILKHNLGDDVDRIIEDCIASGDTLVGVLTLMFRLSQTMKEGQRMRIDVVDAAAPGVLVLREFARQKKMNLELNVGYISESLSAGIQVDGVWNHANYITYPDEMLAELELEVRESLEGLRNEAGNIEVVGDMGSGGQSLPRSFDERCPWNQERNDSHGERGVSYQDIDEFDPDKTTFYFVANGGFLMGAIVRHLHPDLDVNEVVFQAKRLWSSDPKYGYGVLIYDLPEEMFR